MSTNRALVLPARLAVWSLRSRVACAGCCTPSRPFQRGLSTSRSHAGQPRASGPLACTWLTKTPERITPENVTSSLSFPESPPRREHVPVLLVTPAFAPWVDTNHPFLEKWINALYRGTNPNVWSRPAHAVVAIVDKLPSGPSHESAERNTQGDGAAEYEGMSVLFVGPGDIQGKAAQARQVRSTEAENAALLFSIESGKTENKHSPVHEVGLRLAHTLFLNGKENTLFGTRWVYNSSTQRLVLNNSINLSSCIVSSAAKSVQGALDLPLYPVSQRRRVITSMGNILRQVSKHADNESTGSIPASTELEKELPRYIDEHNITDHLVSVWALVEAPGKKYDAEYGSHDHLVKAIQAGGTLHRVMSGGGGWGKKQGLLSLDYEMSFVEPDTNGRLLEDLFSPDDTPSLPEELPPLDSLLSNDLSTLSQVAREGDYIQFFVSVDPDYSGPQELQDRRVSYEFGVVGDTEMSTTQSTEEKDLTVVPGYFGALSEKAITYLHPVVPESENESLESRTKLDIPGTRVALVQQ